MRPFPYILSLFLAASVAFGQDTAEQKSSESETESAERKERRERYRNYWKRYSAASQEERQQMRVDRMVGMATRTYELDDEQKEVVRIEIETMRLERRLEMGEKADEYDQIREQMFQMWRDRQAENEESSWREIRRELRKEPEYQQLRERREAIEEEHPFEWRESLKRVEALLPEEQAEKGRKRIEEWRARRQRWRASEEKSREEKLSTALKEAMASGDQERIAEATRKINEAKLSDEAREKLAKNMQEAIAATLKTQANREAPPEAPSREPLHPWEAYVLEFSKKHSLTPSQQASAVAILKKLRIRAAAIERANASRIEAVNRIEDQKVREKRLAELNQPIDKLFGELKLRLERLLNSKQRAALKAK